MSKRILLTFADTGLVASLRRLERQATEMDVFDRVLIRNEHHLSKDFRREFRRKLVVGSRGFGYWCWKPQIILQTLAELDEGDTLLYLDAGCHLNIGGRVRLLEYFERVKFAQAGILAFQASLPDDPLRHEGRKFDDLRDVTWTKGDLIDHFRLRDNDAILRTPTIVATMILFRRCSNAIALIKQWRSVFSEDFRLVDDTPSKSPNYPEFIEHRHDQACFSIICKLAGVETVSYYETWFPRRTSSAEDGKGADWSALQDFPIHAKRDKPRSRSSRRMISIHKRLTAISSFLNGPAIR